MKQKIILDKDILFKDGKEIHLTEKEIIALRTLQDNLLHTKIELIKNMRIKRSLNENRTLSLHLLRLNTKTRLKTKPLKGAGYYLEDRIFVI